MEFISKSEKETYKIAKDIAEKVKPGDVFLLFGELGAGKSVFVRGVAKGLGVDESMPSPSFTIVNEYQGKFPIYHFDFYRINDSYELYEIGFEEYVYSDGVSFIEWPSKAEELLPEKYISVHIDIKENKREIKILWEK